MTIATVKESSAIEPAVRLIAIPHKALVDPQDASNCFVGSWAGRKCDGFAVETRSSKLMCRHFNEQLVSASGKQAVWMQKEPIKRCEGCIKGER